MPNIPVFVVKETGKYFVPSPIGKIKLFDIFWGLKILKILKELGIIIDVADKVPVIIEVESNVIFAPKVILPFVNVNVPPIVSESLIFIPFELLITKFENLLVLIVPLPEIVWDVVPFKLIVPAVKGLNYKVWPAETWIFPLIEWPGISVTLKYKLPFVIVKLLMLTADVPVVVIVDPNASNSKSA